MKNAVCFLWSMWLMLLPTMFVTSCSDDDEDGCLAKSFVINPSHLVGTWVYTNANGGLEESDNVCVEKLFADGTGEYMSIKEGKWHKQEEKYRIEDHQIVFISDKGESVCDVVYMDYSTLLLGIVADDTLYTLKAQKVLTDYSDKILGTWVADSISLINDDAKTLYNVTITFKEDGTQDCSAVDKDGNVGGFTNKPYLLYGDYLVFESFNGYTTRKMIFNDTERRSSQSVEMIYVLDGQRYKAVFKRKMQERYDLSLLEGSWLDVAQNNTRLMPYQMKMDFYYYNANGILENVYINDEGTGYDYCQKVEFGGRGRIYYYEDTDIYDYDLVYLGDSTFIINDDKEEPNILTTSVRVKNPEQYANSILGSWIGEDFSITFKKDAENEQLSMSEKLKDGNGSYLYTKEDGTEYKGIYYLQGNLLMLVSVDDDSRKLYGAAFIRIDGDQLVWDKFDRRDSSGALIDLVTLKFTRNLFSLY